jgi:hypothetical protein
MSDFIRFLISPQKQLVQSEIFGFQNDIWSRFIFSGK